MVHIPLALGDLPAAKTAALANVVATHGDGLLCATQSQNVVLRWVAEFLEKSVRAHDVCCRIEADEFAVILPDMAQPACEYLLHRLRDKLATLSVRAPFSFRLSMGTASYPEQGTTFDALVRVAEDGRIEDKRRQVPGA